DAGQGISFKDEFGNVIYHIGRDPDTGVVAPEYIGGPDPARPEAPNVDIGGESIKISMSGLDENEEPAPADLLRTLVYASLEAAEFEPGKDVYAGSIPDVDGTMTHRLPGGLWYIAVQWETRSGKLSEMSEAVEVEIPPLVDEEDIQEVLDEAEARLQEAREEFERMNQERKDAIDNINEVVLPALRESLDSKADQSALKELDDKLDNLEFPDLPGGIPTKEEVEAAAKAAEAAAK